MFDMKVLLLRLALLFDQLGYPYKVLSRPTWVLDGFEFSTNSGRDVCTC